MAMLSINFGGADRQALKLLKKWPRGFYISPLVDNFDEHLQKFLAKRHFENGAALFGHQTRFEMQEVRNWARGYLDACTDDEVYGIVQYFVQRVRNYTHIRSLSEAMIPFARATGCHEGRIINVEEARGKIRAFRQMTIGDYGEKIYGKDHGFPPFSIECDCRLEGLVTPFNAYGL